MPPDMLQNDVLQNNTGQGGAVLPVPDQNLEQAVRDRYAAGAAAVQPALCCAPANYDVNLLKLLPQEIIDKDYGCGNPVEFAHAGDVVIDLGSGSGKACYMLSQTVGPAGQVIGLDFNDAMLTLARKYQATMAERIGYANVEFRKARIQDLALDQELLAQWLATHPVNTVEAVDALQAECARLRQTRPLIANGSIDLIISNCVLNLVRPEEKQQLFREMRRVLRPGGRAVISDIVCDVEPDAAMMADPELWSGCISGAFQEERFLQMFTEAGFHGVEILSRQSEPWQVVNGIEFRSMTVRAFKEVPSSAQANSSGTQTVIYKGPWQQVTDERGRAFVRGQHAAVNSAAACELLDSNGPYAGEFIATETANVSGSCCGGSTSCDSPAATAANPLQLYNAAERRGSDSC